VCSNPKDIQKNKSREWSEDVGQIFVRGSSETNIQTSLTLSIFSCGKRDEKECFKKFPSNLILKNKTFLVSLVQITWRKEIKYDKEKSALFSIIIRLILVLSKYHFLVELKNSRHFSAQFTLFEFEQEKIYRVMNKVSSNFVISCYKVVSNSNVNCTSLYDLLCCRHRHLVQQ
jgi:hypothetical protein